MAGHPSIYRRTRSAVAVRDLPFPVARHGCWQRPSYTSRSRTCTRIDTVHGFWRVNHFAINQVHVFL